MNFLAKKAGYTTTCLALSAVLLSTGCSSDNPTQNAGERTKDSVVVDSKSKQKNMQPVQEITLRTVGDEVKEEEEEGKPRHKHYDQDTIEVKAGSVVKLTLINEGSEQSMIHNIVFTRAGKSTQVALAGEKIGAPGNFVPADTVRVLAASPLALPGQTVHLEFTAPKEPGFFDFVCTYPQHYKEMKGVMVVK
ncbi:azurin [Pontibacter sp. 13R65]|uniref:azurin n=1 Tax=Pontibacter sp. 13R65 TaxID=3127458 RepID=UPI00301E2574